ncbi:transmembrane protein 6/97 [Fusarium acuminatum]|uniref:Transmembrane protein 6/97 n=1 Tax=Fusarium acuminatum TaxID=5515 RepID=A0ABZ2WSG0_9HYPO
MAQKPIRDWVYLAIIIPQIFGMIVLDFTEFYPTSLYASSKAPLHFLTIIRNTYLSLSGDPFYGEKFHGEWLHSLYYVELFVQFPFGAYVTWKLASKKPSSGATELAGLVFACLTAMGSVACVAELQSMGPELVSVEQKRNLAWGTYFPYALIPGLMAVDMYVRLLRRVSNDAKPKTQ